MIVKLESPMTVNEIAKAVDGIYDGNPEEKIFRVITDSREAKTGDLFFALGGEHSDGETYVDEAIAGGAIAVSVHARAGVLLVRDTKKALLHLAEEYRRHLSSLLYVIGVTGSVGKTTTKEFLRAILSKKYRVHATEKNYNNELGVPLTLLAAPKKTEVLIVEMGMNHAGEISLLSEAVRPDLSIITNIGTAHIGNLGSREMIAAAKREILVGMQGGVVLVPSDEELLAQIPNRMTVSLQDPTADFFLLPYRTDVTGSAADFYHKERVISDLVLNAPGRHLLSALSFAISAAVLLGLSDREIVSGVSSISDDKIRQSIYKIGNVAIFDDAYNASFESVMAAVETLDLFRGMKRCALIGDMLELGAKTEEYHRRVGATLFAHEFSFLYLHGVYAPFTALGAKDAGFAADRIFENTNVLAPEITAKAILARAEEKEILLVKGSRAVHLERILDAMKEITEGKTNA